MHRIEKDSLGEVRIPTAAYWGTTTQRALDIYDISGLAQSPHMIAAMVLIKRAAAETNAAAGYVPREMADAIVAACNEILDGKLADQFPVDVYQMGAGTSFHMNVNEVLANRANEILGGAKGAYDRVNPNDHVNFGQSTNDVFPTTMRLAVRLALREELTPKLLLFEAALREKGITFDGILKSGRTHLQDAVPIRLGQEFAAYGVAMRECLRFIDAAAASLDRLGIGGSAVGTGLNTAPGYREDVVRRLREATGFEGLVPTDDMCEAMQSQRPFVEVSSALRSLAIEVSRIANDLRLLASGPTTGLYEIVLPPVAPGSSIMPGKVNPSVPEMVNMVCFQVIGNASTVDWAVGAGQLDLNVMMPVIAHNTLFSIRILANMLRVFTDRCIDGITANEDVCRKYAESTLGLVTALNSYIGYANASAVAKEAVKTRQPIMDVIRAKKLLSEEQIGVILDPIAMTRPGIPGKGGA